MSHPMKSNFNKIRYSPVGPGEAHYYEILEKILPLIRTGGNIRTSDAYQRAGGNYSIVSTVFQNIMDKMVAEGTAEKQAKGRYYVKPGTSFQAPVVDRPEIRVLKKLNQGVAPWFSKVYNCWMTPAKNNE